MASTLPGLRILIYSHDTFGLGHLRRCLTIAEHLVKTFPVVQAMIITGASVAAEYRTSGRIRIAPLPGVVKTGDGRYSPLDAGKTIRETVRERAAATLRAACEFRPDIFVVDKEPLGLMGEVVDTLRYLRSIGTRLVLGLRDVLDDSRRLLAEWCANGTIPLMETLYDDVWVYGPQSFYDPLQGIPRSSSFRRRVQYMGFLQRNSASVRARCGTGGHLLVTAGGGGDGVALMRAVVDAYRQHPNLMRRAVLVTGPYMSANDRADLTRSLCGMKSIELRHFETDMEALLSNAAAVVAMGGYNTFCEILSFNKPALIIPRTSPRREQAIRATRAAELGLVDMLGMSDLANTERFAAAIRDLPDRRPPFDSRHGLFLDGLENIAARVAEIAADRALVDEVQVRLPQPAVRQERALAEV